MKDTATSRYTLRLVPGTAWRQWDDFIADQPNGHFLQSWGWGELKAYAGWRPLRFALWDQSQQQIVAGAQVLCRTANHLPLRAGHLAYIPRGPVIDFSNPLLCQPFFQQLNATLRRRGALLLRMEPNLLVQPFEQSVPAATVHAESPAQLLPMFLYPTTPVQPIRTISLDIKLDEATLLARMKEKWRYNVRLAERKGVTVRVAQSGEDVRSWYELMQTTSERDQFGIHTLDYYLHAWHIFAARQQARLFLAEYNGQLLAGIFVALLSKQAIYLYGASSNEQRNLMPNYLLQWQAIRWAKQEGASVYDFWGIPASDDQAEAMAGVYRFKSGWGGEIVRYVGCYEHVYRPLLFRAAHTFIST